MPEVLLFTRKKIHRWNRQVSGTCSKKHENVCMYISCYGISLPLVSCSISFFSYEDPRKHRTDDPEPANEGDIQVE